MAKTENGEQVRFLVSCITNAANGKPDFQAVASELGIVSKAAAQKRYERLLKSHGMGPGSKPAPSKPAEDIDATPKPVKRKAAPRPAGARSGKRAKKEESDTDVAPETKKEMLSDSELSDPLASDDSI